MIDTPPVSIRLSDIKPFHKRLYQSSLLFDLWGLNQHARKSLVIVNRKVTTAVVSELGPLSCSVYLNGFDLQKIAFPCKHNLMRFVSV